MLVNFALLLTFIYHTFALVTIFFFRCGFCLLFYFMPQFDIYSFFAQGVSVFGAAFVFSFFVKGFFFKIPLVLKTRKVYATFANSLSAYAKRFCLWAQGSLVSLIVFVFLVRFPILFIKSFKNLVYRVRFSFFNLFFFKSFLVKSAFLVSLSSASRFFVLSKKNF